MGGDMGGDPCQDHPGLWQEPFSPVIPKATSTRGCTGWFLPSHTMNDVPPLYDFPSEQEDYRSPAFQRPWAGFA